MKTEQKTIRINLVPACYRTNPQLITLWYEWVFCVGAWLYC
ncbi:hypothetical protein ZPAH1_orf00235 [Aeromonas phage ZPAH1]|nr:hypothetical protein ASwh1_186 [Aeromonas phage Aswh_1]QQG33997.1 hypothetical protein ZPAH1_orf00235 [Aeromonas phage ZPAH1]